MALAKTIQIFLPDGNPRGVKLAQITSRTVQAVQVPRSMLETAAKRPELDNVGLYFLIGPGEDDDKSLLYIGEAENCLKRLKQHNRTKDFWISALAIVSKTEQFTKTHIKFLEWYCYDQAVQAARYKLDNDSEPKRPHIGEPLEADLLDNFESIRLLVSTLGYPIFDKISKPKAKDILVCKGKEAFAEGKYTEDGLVVFAGSKCKLEVTKGANRSVSIMRNRLIEEGVLVKDGSVYVFMEDYIFATPSGAAKVVLACSVNGWTAWKYKNGKTLDEVKRQG